MPLSTRIWWELIAASRPTIFLIMLVNLLNDNLKQEKCKSVGVMRRRFCQLPADVTVKLYYSLVYSHLTYMLYTGMGKIGTY